MDWFTEEKNKIIESNLKIDMSDERLQEMQERIQGKAPEEAIEAIGYSQYDINTAIRIAMKDPELLDRVILHKLFGRSHGQGDSFDIFGDEDMKPGIKEKYDIVSKNICELLEEETKKPLTIWQTIKALCLTIKLIVTGADEIENHKIL